LLDAFPGNVTGNRGIIRFAGDFINLIDVDDAALGFVYIVISVLQQGKDDVFNVLTDIAGLCQTGCIRDRKRYV
jgi:hypothetical protein